MLASYWYWNEKGKPMLKLSWINNITALNIFHFLFDKQKSNKKRFDHANFTLHLLKIYVSDPNDIRNAYELGCSHEIFLG